MTDDAIMAMYVGVGRRLIAACDRIAAVSGIRMSHKTLSAMIRQIEAERAARTEEAQ